MMCSNGLSTTIFNSSAMSQPGGSGPGDAPVLEGATDE